MSNIKSIEQYHDFVRAKKMIDVLDYQIKHNSSVVEACEATGLAHRTFYSWLEKGILDNVLHDEAEVITRSAQRIVLDNWIDIIGALVKIASLDEKISGVNPVTAARMLREVGGVQLADPDDVRKARLDVAKRAATETFFPEMTPQDHSNKSASTSSEGSSELELDPLDESAN